MSIFKDALELNAHNPFGNDCKYKETIDVVKKTRSSSISLLQRKLKIGYVKAAAIVDRMERDGLIGEYRGSKEREIFIT